MAVLKWRFLESLIVRLAVATYALPLVAIGPILAVALNGDEPKIVLTVISVFFITLVGSMHGLQRVERPVLDIIRAFGGSSRQELVKARLRASLPSIFASLQIAAPAAVLGSVIAEYLGATSGLGVAMISSQDNLQVDRTWALALVITACAGAGYGLVGIIARVCVPRLSGGSYSRARSSQGT